MKSRSQGTFVIPWSQTETDGLRAAPLGNLSVGASWCWTGSPVRVDGPQGVLVLTEAVGIEDLRKRAARMVRRLMGGLAMARPIRRRQPGAGRKADHAARVGAASRGPAMVNGHLHHPKVAVHGRQLTHGHDQQPATAGYSQ